jgi:hypothetical protein
MRPRVCVLTQSNPFNWTPFYIRAFRRHCDTITVGPRLGNDMLGLLNRQELAHLIEPNDIDRDLTSFANLHEVLPEGWRPQLVVAISGGGIPMHLNMAALRCPAVYLSIDTWQSLLDYSEALHYDLVFTGQREFTGPMRATGSRHARWLPLGADPELHCPEAGEEDHDIAFAGGLSNDVHRERVTLLRALARNHTVLAEENAYGSEANRLFARGRVAFNHAAVRDVNMRVFEALAMNRPLLTNRDSAENGLLDMFTDGVHLAVYDGEEDLLRQAGKLLADEETRRAMAAAGRAEVLARHTYDHRVLEILATLDELRPGWRDIPGEPAPRDERIVSHLPRLPGVVIDAGMALEASKVRLRRQGVTRLIGVHRDPGRLGQRAGSYDEALPWPAADLPSQVDTVVLDGPRALGDTLRASVDAAWKALEPGGWLVARVTAHDIALEPGLDPSVFGFSKWFKASNFHVTLLHPCGQGGYIITVRKRTRPLRDIVLEYYIKLNMPGFDAHHIASLVPEGM